MTGWTGPCGFGPLLHMNAKLEKVVLNLFQCDASRGSEKVHFIFTLKNHDLPATMLSEPANSPFICQHENEAQSSSENIFLSANVMGAYFLHLHVLWKSIRVSL